MNKTEGAATCAHFVVGKGHSNWGKFLLSETSQLNGIQTPTVSEMLE